MGWMRTDYDFPLHAANIIISHLSLHRWFNDKLPAVSGDPQKIADFLTILLGVLNDGRFHNGQILRIFQAYDRACWIVTIAHPSLPAVEVGALLEEIDVAITEERMQFLLKHLEDYFAAKRR